MVATTAARRGRHVRMGGAAREQEVVFFTGTLLKVLATEYDVRADDRFIYLAEIPDSVLLQGYSEDS